MLEIVFYDRYMEEKLATKIKNSETTMIQNALAQLKLESKVEHRKRRKFS